MHHCLGATLARLEASVAFSSILSRLPSLQLNKEEIQYKDDFSSRRLMHLNLVIP